MQRPRSRGCCPGGRRPGPGCPHSLGPHQGQQEQPQRAGRRRGAAAADADPARHGEAGARVDPGPRARAQPQGPGAPGPLGHGSGVPRLAPGAGGRRCQAQGGAGGRAGVPRGGAQALLGAAGPDARGALRPGQAAGVALLQRLFQPGGGGRSPARHGQRGPGGVPDGHRQAAPRPCVHIARQAGPWAQAARLRAPAHGRIPPPGGPPGARHHGGPGHGRGTHDGLPAGARTSAEAGQETGARCALLRLPQERRGLPVPRGARGAPAVGRALRAAHGLQPGRPAEGVRSGCYLRAARAGLEVASAPQRHHLRLRRRACHGTRRAQGLQACGGGLWWQERGQGGQHGGRNGGVRPLLGRRLGSVNDVCAV
mmetsp:Transcript_30254/g.96681  ORF Transcript_30254/g.96681 Transcript_30254/m.96681 type:complete len:369 (-) Transcript_30254:156-1262(-)